MMNAPSDSMRKRWPVYCAAIWIVLFLVAFFSFDLPNSNPRVSRWGVASNLHFLYLDLIDPLDDKAGENSGWRYFPQRLPLIGTALFLFIGAAGLGGLLLRSIIPPRWLSPGEFLFFACGVGLSASSLLVLACGLCGSMSNMLIGGLLGICIAVSAIVESISPDGWIRHVSNRRLTSKSHAETSAKRSDRQISYETILKVLCGGACLPFILCMILGASLPSTDFDVKEYHLEGPKEWFLQGEITFLPHNVYTSFPFLTEMLLLEGMIMSGDWWTGSLVGQLLLMGFGPLTGWGVFLVVRRWWGSTAGWLGILIHMSTPWTYRISTIAYTEGGLSYYLLASLFAALLLHDRLTGTEAGGATSPNLKGNCLLAGFLAGSAMACKYPGVISVVIPVGAYIKYLMFSHARRNKMRPFDRVLLTNLACLALGVAASIGPWLIKNVAETGNPVYPLLYSVFGGTDWDDELNAKWKRGHSPDTYAVSDMAEKVIDVSMKSDWLSPLLFGFAPLALLVRGRRKFSVLLWVYVIYLFGTWWLLTHRIDRFWVSLIPVVSVLAGVGVAWSAEKFWTRVAGIVLCAATIFNLGFVTTGLCGNNAYLLDLNVARVSMAQITSPELVLLNHLDIPKGKSVLCIGDAELFDADFPVIYSTVFDRPVLDDWWGIPEPGKPRNTWKQRDSAEIHAELRERNVAYVYVNWSEILRYRRTYGYTDYVIPGRFRILQRSGVLGPNLPINRGLAELDAYSDRERAEIERELLQWAPELIVTRDGKKYFITSEIFPVR